MRQLIRTTLLSLSLPSVVYAQYECIALLQHGMDNHFQEERISSSSSAMQ